MNFTLKNGKTILIREAKHGDAKKAIEYMKQISIESANLLREPEEVTLTLDFEEDFLKRTETSKHDVMLSVWDQDKLISLTGFNGSSLNRISHRVSLGISVLKEYQGLGLGTHLLSLLCNKAIEYGKTKIELDVREDNKAAIHIYEKLGFVKEGTRKNGINDKGRYINLVLLGKELKHE